MEFIMVSSCILTLVWLAWLFRDRLPQWDRPRKTGCECGARPLIASDMYNDGKFLHTRELCQPLREVILRD